MIAWLCAALALAQDGILANGDFSRGLDGWTQGDSAGHARFEVVGSGADRAVRISVAKVEPVRNAWDVELKQTLARGFAAGDTLDVRLMARSASGSRVRSGIQLGESPFSSFGAGEASLSSAWQEVRYSASISQAMPGGSLQFYIHANYQAGSIEVKDIQIRRMAGSSFSR